MLKVPHGIIHSKEEPLFLKVQFKNDYLCWLSAQIKVEKSTNNKILQATCIVIRLLIQYIISFLVKQTPFGTMSHQRRAPSCLARVSPGSTVGGCKHLHWEAVHSTWFSFTSNLSISRLVIQACPEILRITPSIYENAIQMWQPTYAKRSK